jgi:hypothetical protein
MPHPLYLDECVDRHLAPLLRMRTNDVLTALEAGTLGFDDESQLVFATRHNRVILTHNQRHFQRLHVRFLAANRRHAGIMLIPNGSRGLVDLRAAMLATWLDDPGGADSRLVRWHDLQGELIRGLRVDGFGESEVRQALAIDPMSH